ncbi:MAG: CvpA family protein [Clostridium sp.]|jgi:hypothetical protein|nr:CvpA family protein [Clostridium sp.]
METKTTAGGSKSFIIPPEKPGLKIALSVIATLIAAAVGYYLYLPALNPKSIQLWLYLAGVVVSFVVFLAIFSGATRKQEYMPFVRRKAFVPVIIVVALVLTMLVGYLVGCPLFRARDYSQLLSVNNAEATDFAADIEQVDAASFSKIPRLDEDSAKQIAPKAMSDLGDSSTVSQYTVYPTYTQINYKGSPVRVVPLQYANIIKWLTNTSRGLPGYIIIDMANEEPSFVMLDEDSYMRYSPAEHFGKLLKRHLRFNYPTYLFGEATFEIDDNGKPYWICPRLDNTIGLFGGTDIIGAVLVEADSEDGDSVYYGIDELRENPELQWIDRVYDSQLLVKQFNYAGKYGEGFWNSLLGQRDVRAATDGYNYLALNDDVYLYTGVSSVTSDQSIIGFVLINQRTKQSSFYRVSGATEKAAMGSAEGYVTDLGYQATFPLLINVDGQPTYYMSLKDTTNNNQIVKQYALINVRNYNKIGAHADSISKVLELYKTALANNAPASEESGQAAGEDVYFSGKISDIRTAVIGGESTYYITLTLDDNEIAKGEMSFRTTAAENESVVFLNKGQWVKILVKGYSQGTDLLPINAISLK